MAVGRQDYQAGVVPIKSGYSLSQTPFYEGEAEELADGGQAYLCFKLISVGYQLHVTGVRVSCNIPGIQKATYYLGLYYEADRYFDLSFTDNFPELSPLVVVSGLFVAIYIKNETGETVSYNGEIFGFMQQIES